MLYNILATISLILVILNLRRLIGIFPSLMACLIRAKESINLEASAQLSRDRDLLATLMTIPFILIAWQFRLYDPAFIGNCNEYIGLGITAGVAAAYFMIRKLLEFFLRPSRSGDKNYKTACKTSRTFFALLTILLIATGCLLSFIGLAPQDIRTAMLWISGAIYLMFIIRKTQILVSYTSFFAGFLYLCALEIIPTGALVASAFVF